MNNLKISKFDGITDVNVWIEDFQLNKILLKWKDAELKAIIPAILSGPAKVWLDI